MKRHRLGHSWGEIALALLVGAMLPNLLIYAFTGRQAGRVISEFFWKNLVISGCIGSLAWLVLPPLGPLFGRTRFPWNYLLLLLPLAAVGSAGLMAALGILTLAGQLPASAYWPFFSDAIRSVIVITLIIGYVAFAWETSKHRLDASNRELRARQAEAEMERQAATEARLESLESRVHPHFLFNTLNSISALIREDPPAAERLVERLAALLRFSLDSNCESLVPLGHELKIVVDYLEIERARFGPRLRYSIEVPEELAEVEVPPMSVQTLVENAVKHAIAPRREGGEVTIRASSGEQGLELVVADDGPGFTADAIAEGHGLDNLRSRLAVLFGDPSGFHVERREGRTAVTLRVPQRVRSA